MENINRSKLIIESRAKDYAQWYLDVAKMGELYQNSPTPGCITFMPKSVKIWEKIKKEISEALDTLGVQNLYLPLLIPISYLEKEKNHVEGFAPECAIVTHGGGKQLPENLVIRPTSETLFCDFFKKILNSYKDLPLLYNQWVNVMRREKRTRPFLRTTEFYWQEGHTLHETLEEANEFALYIQNNVYINTIRKFLAIDGIIGEKSESEKFAGADKTYTFESMMSNGRALQMGTAHILGGGFAKQFDIKFLDKDNNLKYPYYTSWGSSTRLIGALISSHSDDKGLIIPPKLSEYKGVILPIYGKDNKEDINNYIIKVANNIIGDSKEIPMKGQLFKSIINGNNKLLVDYRDCRIGEKINDFEISGYPIRIVIGANELKDNQCIIVSRITGEKIQVDINKSQEIIESLLNKGQDYLFQQNQKRLIENTIPCYSHEDIGDTVNQGKFAIFEWDGNCEFESKIKENYKATIRCIPFEGQFTDNLLKLKNSNNKKVIIARNF